MILTQKHNDGTFQYYNLRENKSYTLIHNEFAEVSTEVPIPPAEDFLDFLDDETEYLQKCVDNFKGEDKLELVKLQTKLEFLKDYDPFDSMEVGEKFTVRLKIK